MNKATDLPSLNKNGALHNNIKLEVDSLKAFTDAFDYLPPELTLYFQSKSEDITLEDLKQFFHSIQSKKFKNIHLVFNHSLILSKLFILFALESSKSLSSEWLSMDLVLDSTNTFIHLEGLGKALTSGRCPKNIQLSWLKEEYKENFIKTVIKALQSEQCPSNLTLLFRYEKMPVSLRLEKELAEAIKKARGHKELIFDFSNFSITKDNKEIIALLNLAKHLNVKLLLNNVLSLAIINDLVASHIKQDLPNIRINLSEEHDRDNAYQLLTFLSSGKFIANHVFYPSGLIKDLAKSSIKSLSFLFTPGLIDELSSATINAPPTGH